MMERQRIRVLDMVEKLEDDYEKVRDIIEDEDYQESDKFQEFLGGLERRNDLEVRPLRHAPLLNPFMIENHPR